MVFLTIRPWLASDTAGASAMAAATKYGGAELRWPGGVVQCGKCGKAECLRRNGWAVRNYWRALYLVLTEGHSCTACGEQFPHLKVSKQTYRKWRKKFPSLPWAEIYVEIANR